MKITVSGFTLLFFVCSLFCNVHAQIITTIAGNGGLTLGDGGPATNAGFNNPYDVALDGLGNYYITDGDHNRIRKVDAAGIITTVAGNGTAGYNGDGIAATAAMLNRPVGLAIDHQGNIYFSDAVNNRVRKIDTAGIITTIAGNGSAVYNGDNIPADSAAISEPHFLALDDTGNLYIAEHAGARIRKVNSLGVITTVAGTGETGYTGDGGPATAAKIAGPYGIVLDSGNIIFSNSLADVVRKIDASGIITTIAGYHYATTLGDGGPADSARLDGPVGVKLDAGGNLYIADANQNRVRRVDKYTHIITTIAGKDTFGFSGDGGLAINAKLFAPTGLAFDTSGNIYIAVLDNQRIRFINNAALGINTPQLLVPSFISVYPNPNSGEFVLQIKCSEVQPIDIIITDVIGRMIYLARTESEQQKKIQLDQPAGTYFVTVRTAKGVLTEKMTIE